MRFKLLMTTGYCNTVIADTYPSVKEFGYEKIEVDRGHYRLGEKVKDVDEYINICSLNELKRFMQGIKDTTANSVHDFVIGDDDDFPDDPPYIEIYDGWRE